MRIETFSIIFRCVWTWRKTNWANWLSLRICFALVTIHWILVRVWDKHHHIHLEILIFDKFFLWSFKCDFLPYTFNLNIIEHGIDGQWPYLTLGSNSWNVIYLFSDKNDTCTWIGINHQSLINMKVWKWVISLSSCIISLYVTSYGKWWNHTIVVV